MNVLSECLPFELEKQPWDIQQPIVAEAYYNNVGNGTMAVLINMKVSYCHNSCMDMGFCLNSNLHNIQNPGTS